MAQPTQAKFTLPNGDWCAVDNSAAGATVTSNGTPPNSNNWTGIGFDITVPGAVAQATNPFGDTGSVLLDTAGNDTVYVDPGISTVVGNPVSNISPTGKIVTKVLQNPLSATLSWKNPA